MSIEKTILEKVRAIVFGEEKAPNKFMDANLEDGTLIQVEPTLEEGAAVVVIKEDGEPVAANNDTHTLADGTKITTVDGIITEIMPKEEEVIEDEVIEEVPMSEPAQVDKVKKVVESIIKESHFATQEEITLTKAEFNSAIAQAKKEILDSVFAAFKAFADESVETPVVPAKVKFKKEPKKSWADNFTVKK